MSLRSAASLVLISPSNYVLFLLRPKTGTFSSMHVFPGGTIDSSDPSPSYAALRETYEETGLLLTGAHNEPVVFGAKRPSTYDEAVRSVYSNKFPTPPGVTDIWSQENESKVLGLDRFSVWVTPKNIKKRFSTQFFIYKVPETYTLVPSEDSNEVAKLEWLTPSQVLDNFRKGQLGLVPPQFYLMTSILERGVSASIEALKSRVFEPSPKEVFEDGGIKMDLGNNEYSVLHKSETGITLDPVRTTILNKAAKL